ncbi:MAG: PAS domain-containing protein [Planctomycetota bacterium]|nr:PAS domain-containing protein [Planctomycetota bacterium]
MDSAPTQILLIDPDPAAGLLIADLLAGIPGLPFELNHADDLPDALDDLNNRHTDLVLLALAPPQSQHADTIAAVRVRVPDLPIILLGDRNQPEPLELDITNGVQDYLVKGRFDAPLLTRAIRYALQRHFDAQILRRESEILSAAVEGSNDAVFVKDLDGRYMMINSAGAGLLGKQVEEVLGQDDSTLFAPESGRLIMDRDRRIMLAGITETDEETVTAAGITRTYLSTKGPYRDANGNIAGLAGISRDITESKRLREELIEQRNLLRTLIDNLPDYIFIKDVAGRFITNNLAHARILGAMSCDQIVGKTDFDCLPLDVAVRYHADEQQVVRTGQPLIDREEPFVDPVGNRRWFSTTKVPLRDREGKIIGLVGLSRDFTERRLAAEMLTNTNARLAHREEQLMDALSELKGSHDKLKATQLQLIQAEKLKSTWRLAAGVAHEVKNPLAIISLGMEYLLGNLPAGSDDVRITLEEMRSAIKRADSVIRGLLNYSQLTRLEASPGQLNCIIEQAMLLARHELVRCRVTVVRELAEDLPLVRLDANKMEQVFINVFLNAAHAMPRGGTMTVRTSVRADRNEGNAKFVVAEVEDTGAGIPPNKLGSVFEPFFTTKSPGKGTGLGLSVSKTIVELHGGTIAIANRDGGGARATISLKGVHDHVRSEDTYLAHR